MTIQKIHYFEQIIEIGSNWERDIFEPKKSTSQKTATAILIGASKKVQVEFPLIRDNSPIQRLVHQNINPKKFY